MRSSLGAGATRGTSRRARSAPCKLCGVALWLVYLRHRWHRAITCWATRVTGSCRPPACISSTLRSARLTAADSKPVAPCIAGASAIYRNRSWRYRDQELLDESVRTFLVCQVADTHHEPGALSGHHGRRVLHLRPDPGRQCILLGSRLWTWHEVASTSPRHPHRSPPRITSSASRRDTRAPVPSRRRTSCSAGAEDMVGPSILPMHRFLFPFRVMCPCGRCP